MVFRNLEKLTAYDCQIFAEEGLITDGYSCGLGEYIGGMCSIM
jgi:hypothetical protein